MTTGSSELDLGNKLLRGFPTLAEESVTSAGILEPAKKVSRSSLSAVQSMPGTFVRRDAREEGEGEVRRLWSPRRNRHILQFYGSLAALYEIACPNCKQLYALAKYTWD